MPKAVSRAGVDYAGGMIAGPGLYPKVTVNGAPVAVIGTPVLPHGEGTHAAAKLEVGSRNVFVGPALLPLCGFGDKEPHIASCGHPITTGSRNTFVN